LATLWFGGVLFLHPLFLAMAYIFAQDNPNTNVTIFIVSFPAKYLPYALLALTWLTGGPAAALAQFPGLLAGHLYDFLTRLWPMFGGGTNYLATPAFIKQWYIGMQGAGAVRREYGTMFRPADPSAAGRPAAPAGGNTGAAGGVFGARGPGRRLGGD
jgi:Derlin-2/3